MIIGLILLSFIVTCCNQLLQNEPLPVPLRSNLTLPCRVYVCVLDVASLSGDRLSDHVTVLVPAAGRGEALCAHTGFPFTQANT